MAEHGAETTFQWARRHLRNGYVILTTRGIVALYGAAMRELAKLIDSPVGTFLAPRDILRDGPRLLRDEGLRATIGAVLRQVAAEYDPPLGRRRNPVNEAMRANAVRYYYTYELTKPDGVVPSRRPVNELDFALETPFGFRPDKLPNRAIAAVVHAFYPDLLPLILEKLANIPVAVDLYVSTDTEDKRAIAACHAAAWTKGSVEIRVFPNRGRDIGAKFVGFRDIYENYDLFIHLHTKRSPHGGAPLARWRDYLLDNLLGSPEIVRSNLALFEDPKLGIVFPQHLFEIRGILNWGYDYDLARTLLKRMGISIDKNIVLEFPSGSMFWGRSEAIRPLLETPLQFSDFGEESGQVDGTLAHAIERSILMIAEAKGYEWLKVVRRDLYPVSQTVLSVLDKSDLAAHRLKVFQPCLANVDASVRPSELGIASTRPILSYPSRNARPRLNLLVPTVNPHQTFGGLATAQKLFSDLMNELAADFDRRIIVTDADVLPAGYASLPDYKAVPFIQSRDAEPMTIVDANERDGGRLDLRSNDIFLATAWWTARFALDLECDRRRYFGNALPFVYLIQDDEPYFYGWSSQSALADSTYRHGERTIAVINSEELFAVMTAQRQFLEAVCIPYRMNEKISALLAPAPRERQILVYGRPSVSRNAFELICDGLFRWQQRDPIRASRWRILFLGEEFEESWSYPVQNSRVGGKVSLERYADELNRSSVGISLMISPHPSYPPLEMAEAGLLAITNSYAGKDLRERFPAIVSLDRLEPSALADAIESSVERAERHIGATVERRTPRRPALERRQEFDAARIATLLRDSVSLRSTTTERADAAAALEE